MAGIDFIVTGRDDLGRVQKFLDRLPPPARPSILPKLGRRAVNIVKTYEPYQYITRGDAYPNAPAGAGWFSGRQRRYVMMMIRRGLITPGTPRRTGNLAESWAYRVLENRVELVNSADYAEYVQGNETQSRHEAMAGWLTVSEKLSGNIDKLMNTVRAAYRTEVDRICRALGLKVR